MPPSRSQKSSPETEDATVMLTLPREPIAKASGARSNIKNEENAPSVPRTFGSKLVNILSDRMITVFA
jgi:hypothetical protein